jgi:hypothetical protein
MQETNSEYQARGQSPFRLSYPGSFDFPVYAEITSNISY